MEETTDAIEEVSPVDTTPDAPVTDAVPISAPAASGDLPALPPQYSTAGDAGFFNRQNESVLTAVTVGPDGAIYVSELSALPYPTGYAQVVRIAQGEGGVSFDGTTPAGVAQTYASGFEQINGLTFDDEGALYVLEYVAGSSVYNPTIDPADLPPSRIVRVGTDGVRETISGDELLLGNYVLAHEGKIYAAINDADTENGKLLAYERDAETGEWSHEVVAKGLLNPRGLDIGPDGKLYILETGIGTPADDPDVENAPVIPFIPGLVSERGGYTAAISRLDPETGEVERVYEGLPSFREFNPATGEDRVISIGSNGFGITDDGTVYVATGGGLSEQSAGALGDFAESVRGVQKLTGLFEEGAEPSYELVFDSVAYAAAFGPDGATTLFNTQSNLNDIEIGPNGEVYTVDAARNVLYELTPGGETVLSVTPVQKTPPVLTPVQYALVLEAGGDPTADYRVEINEVTFKGANELPDTPGRARAVLAAEGAPPGEAPTGAPPGAPPGTPPNEAPTGAPLGTSAGEAPAGVPPRGEDAAIGEILGGGEGEGALVGGPGDDALTPGDAVVPPNGAQPAEGTEEAVPVDNPGAPPVVVVEPTTGAEPPFEVPGELPGVNVPGSPDGPPTDAGEFDPNNPPPNFGPPTPLIPGPVDPIAPAVLPGNPYSVYFEPFFGNYAPAPGQAPELPDGEGGRYQVGELFVFGDRLTEDGGRYGKAAVAEKLGVDLPIDEGPYSPYGNFTDGLNWTTYLARILGVEEGPSVRDPDGDVGEEDTNFSYLDATARALFNPTDPLQPATALTDFAGQIDTFETIHGSFSPDDLVVVSFGGNDLTLPPAEGQSPEAAAMASLWSTLGGIARLASLGAENFLVPNLVNVEIVPIFSDPAFQEALGVPPGFFGPVVEAYNEVLESALDIFESMSGLDITLFDVNAVFEAIVEEPGAYGFVNVEEPVLITPPNPGVEPVYNPAIVGRDPAVQHSTLFLDTLFSPTALAQSILAETARDALLGRDADEAAPSPTAPVLGTGSDDMRVAEGAADTFAFSDEAGGGAGAVALMEDIGGPEPMDTATSALLGGDEDFGDLTDGGVAMDAIGLPGDALLL